MAFKFHLQTETQFVSRAGVLELGPSISPVIGDARRARDPRLRRGSLGVPL